MKESGKEGRREKEGVLKNGGKIVRVGGGVTCFLK